jgi:diguanylate cyclase (GGDEF)-like protein/putative nucleotidyltransferase with HDIG domain
MTSSTRLTKAGRLYVAAVATAGTGVVLHSLYLMMQQPVRVQWFVLAGLTLLSGSFTVRIPTVPARLSVSETFVFAAVLLFGPAAATVIVVLDSLIISYWRRKRTKSAAHVFFNMAAPAVAIWAAAHAFYWMAGVRPLSEEPRPILSLALPLLALAILYFVLNSWLIAWAVAFEKRLSAFKIWRESFLWLSLNYFSGASAAALLLPYLQSDDSEFVRVIVVLLPLLLVSYLTFKTALGRVDDANRHLGELNRLYLSTIETLAMAIDAKDQITHGHIRRVQQYAVGLAKKLGMQDAAQISAIEAASLLHDMGKLAVPEYILNKPGPLTPAEFEKMKLHASVGADILSAIDFPYPVVPIVRHHHENWDGSGYPQGLKGSEIPIGARILSVVDCFDALTSDRPYRPRLSDSEAIRVLLERRGTMYDPLIVDTFIQVHSEISPQHVASSDLAKDGLSAITRGSITETAMPTSGARLDDITASTEEMLVLYDLARGLTGQVELADAADVISKHLRRIVPASTVVFYLYDSDRDELVAAHAFGDNTAHFSDLRIPRGQRLTGWVAANRQTILNSDPTLDLGEVARVLRPPLRSCLSTPLQLEKALVGVLTVYSTHRDAFTEDHRRIVEVIARQVSKTVKHGIDVERYRIATFRDRLTGLPNLQHLERFIASETALGIGGTPLSIIFIDIQSLRSTGGRLVRGASGPAAADQILANAADAIRRALRGADVLFRYGDHEFVVLLTQTTRETAQAVMKRIEARLHESDRLGTDEAAGAIMGVASLPDDGTTLAELVQAARRREERPPPTTPDRPSSIH